MNGGNTRIYNNNYYFCNPIKICEPKQLKNIQLKILPLTSFFRDFSFQPSLSESFPKSFNVVGFSWNA